MNSGLVNIAAETADVADYLSEQLATPDAVKADRDIWQGQSLSRGAAGIAVLHGTRAQPGHGSSDRVHAWLSLAVHNDLSTGPGTGLWFGMPAAAFAVAASAPGQYASATQVLRQAVADMTQARLRAANDRIAAAARPALSEFDLVRGLTGLGAYLLHFEPDPRLLRQILHYLVRLTEPVPANDSAGTHAPGWWSGDNPGIRTTADGGHANFGAAHGICGPLSLLAQAMRRGITVAGQEEAIDRICAWLDAWRQTGASGSWWPEYITLHDLRIGHPSQDSTRRPSWCYGTPGLARAQQLAAIARQAPERQADAEDALARCVEDPAQLARLSGPGLCHGWAGVVTVTWHAAREATSPRLAAASESLTRTLAASVCGALPYGLMNGIAGAAITLHTIATQQPRSWPGCLLIT